MRSCRSHSQPCWLPVSFVVLEIGGSVCSFLVGFVGFVHQTAIPVCQGASLGTYVSSLPAVWIDSTTTWPLSGADSLGGGGLVPNVCTSCRHCQFFECVSSWLAGRHGYLGLSICFPKQQELAQQRTQVQLLQQTMALQMAETHR